MRKLVIGFVGLMLVAGWAMAAVKNLELKLEGLSCQKCVANVEKTLKKIEGVSNIKADLEKKLVWLSLDEKKASLDQVKKALAEKGYKVVKAKEVKESMNR